MRLLYLLIGLTVAYAAKSQNQVVFSDDFSTNTNNWPESNNERELVKVSTQRGMYQVQHKSKIQGQPSAAMIDVDLNESKNFRISTLLYRENGSKNYAFGLIWGGTDTKYYMFIISSSGHYAVSKMIDGDWQDLTPDGWHKTETVSQGKHSFNKLTLSKIGDTYHFEVNDLKIATMKCGPFFGKKIGFLVHYKQKVMVDWIKVEYL